MPLFRKFVRHPIAATTGAVGVLVLVPFAIGPATASSAGTGFQAVSLSAAPQSAGVDASVMQASVTDASALRAAAAESAYSAAVRADGPSSYWHLDETSGSTAKDEIAGDTGTYSSGVLLGEAGSPAEPSGTSIRFPGDGAQTMVSDTAVVNPTVYSLETWFRTTTTSGGRLIGFGSSHSGTSTNRDRHIYMLDTGQLRYGIYVTASALTIDSPNAYNDGQWHHVVATQGSGGEQLYVDGALVATGTAVRPQNYTGYWRLGTDRTWGGATTDSLAGSLDEAAVYPSVLSPESVLKHYELGAAAPNKPPTAAFTTACTDLTCRFDSSRSSDADGKIASYAWDFGDGKTSTEASPSHTYAAGTYTVTLVVTDDDGSTGSTTGTVTTVEPNRAPVASFSSAVTNLSVAFDATASTDSDGKIVSYGWDFGDGSTDTTATPTHRYAAAGSYPVVLTVTDNDGATDTFTETVVATDRVVASDAFTRTTASGLGNAEIGGAWTVTGAAVSTSVADGSARLQVGPARTNQYKLASTSSRDTDLVHLLWLEQAPTGAGASLWSTVRSTATGDYRVKLRVAPSGVMTSQLVKVVNGTESALTNLVTVPGGSLAVNQRIRIRVQGFGASPTTLRAKIWSATAAEPDAWLETVTDSTDGLQVAGSVGLASNLAGNFNTSVIRIDDLVATERTELTTTP